MQDLVPNWPEFQEFFSRVRQASSRVHERGLFGEKGHDSRPLKPSSNRIRGTTGDIANKQRQCVGTLGETSQYGILYRQGHNRNRKLAKRADGKMLDRCPTRVPKEPLLVPRCSQNRG